MIEDKHLPVLGAISTLVAALLFSGTLAASSKLVVGDGIDLYVLNGEEHQNASSQLLNGVDYHILREGRNQIVVSLTAEVSNGSDLELETTHPSVITFNAEGQTIRLNAPKIKTQRDFRHFTKSGNWLLKDDKNQEVAYSSDWLLKSGFQLSRNIVRELKEYNLSKNIKNLSATNIIKPINPEGTSNMGLPPASNLPMTMLMYWYTQADESTRQNFRRIISSEQRVFGSN